MRSYRRFLAGAVLAALFPVVGGQLVAQDKVLSKQQRAQLKFKELHERMQKLQATLRETEPDESRVLQVGNKYVQEARIHEDMAAVKKLLEDSSWDQALERMGEVRKELANLMDLLLNRDTDLEKMLEEIARLEGLKKRVEKLIADQQAEKEDAARAEALMKHLEGIERAQKELDALMRDQKDLRGEANQAGLSAAAESARRMAGRQGELRKDAEDLADELKDLEAEQDRLSEGAGEPKAAGQPGSGESGSGGACSGSCKGAAGSMGKARQKLQQNRPERSLDDMDRALDQLQAAKEALEEMGEEARRKLLELPFEQQVRKQEVTRIETDTLSKDMEKGGQGEDGEAGKKTPGTENVQQAVPKQKAAAGMLKERKPGEAKQKQQDAKEDLEEAKKALEDALAQLRQQLQDEVLRALEERFGAMLAKQKEISARTKVTDRLRGEALTADGSLPAALVKRCRQLSTGEMELASEAGDALKLLEEEGTTAVFPEIVSELEQDLIRVGKRLGREKTGKATQAMQAEIEQTLSMLINALRRAIEEGEGECGQCNGEPPLVPLSAELKLVLALQKRVAERTGEYDRQVPEQLRVTEEARDEALEISRKQGRVEDLTRKLAVKLNKEDQANDR